MPLTQTPDPTTTVTTHRFRTVDQARDLARQLAQGCPKPAAVEAGLFELFMNAIEHGNLEIGGLEKGVLIAEDRLVEEIETRLITPPYCNRRAEVDVGRDKNAIIFTVRDEGPGFNWRIFMDREAGSLQQQFGRGILIARKLAFDTLTYSSTGNSVTASVFFDE
jgi:anti-sigma regulatory factor (Ser/Thr protein kinase)